MLVLVLVAVVSPFHLQFLLSHYSFSYRLFYSASGYYYSEKNSPPMARAYIFLRIPIFNFSIKIETSSVCCSLFVVIQGLLRLDSNQLETFFFVHLLLGTRKCLPPLARARFFCRFLPRSRFKAFVFNFFSYFRDLFFFFNSNFYLLEELYFAQHLVATRKKNYLLWLEHAFFEKIVFNFLTNNETSKLSFFIFCSLETFLLI